MLIRKRSTFDRGKLHTMEIPVTPEQLHAWNRHGIHAKVQQALPELERRASASS